MKMEKELIKNLAEKIVSAVLNTETLPIRTGMDYGWQYFAFISDADAADLDTIKIETDCAIYETGLVQFSIKIRQDKSSENLKDAYKRLKAKNLVLLSIERAKDAKRADDESTELLEKAADMLGITPEQALKTINK